MAWQRNIPFGYTMKNGEIRCCPPESAAVRDIFRLYLDGAPYSKIADEMMRKGIHYHSHTAEWNKHMVKRILENERYLGEKGYPGIIEHETFMGVQLLRGDKTSYTPCPSYIKSIREKAVCGICGAKMLRDTKTTRKVRWYCENDGCGNRHYIEDEDVRAALTEKLITLAQSPSLLDWPIPRHDGELTLEVMRIQNEVNRELNKVEPSIEYTKMLILACAAEKYSGLPDYTPHYKIRKMMNQLDRLPIDETICGELFHIAVKEIGFEVDGKLSLRLINENVLEPTGKEN